MSLRLFWQIASVEARTAMSYRGEFWVNAIAGFVAQFGVAWFLWQALFRESGETTIGGFGVDGMVLYYVTVLLLGKLVRGEDFTSIADDIYQGGLNRYIVFPTGYLPFKFAQHIGKLAPALVQLLLFGAVFVIYVERAPEVAVTAGSLARTVAAVAVGNVLHFVLSAPIHMVAFWADNVWSLEVAKRFIAGILGGMMVPLTLFPEWSQPLLELLPFRYFFDFPARVLLGQIGLGEWAQGMVVAFVWVVVFLGVIRIVSRRGAHKYTGVGI